MHMTNIEAIKNNINITNIDIVKPAVEVDLSKVNIETRAVLSNLEVSENGVYTPPDNIDGFGKVTVEVLGANPYFELSKNVLGDYTETYELNDNNLVFDESITEHKLREYAFYGNNRIHGIVLNKITELGESTFAFAGTLPAGYKYNIKYIRSESVKKIGKNCFYYNYELSEVYLPNCQSIENYGFYICNSLKDVYLPNCESIGSYGFYSCKNIKQIELPKIKSISAQMFNRCEALEKVILRYNGVAKLSNINAFSSTPIKTSADKGFIYVPDELVEEYKVATNWITYADKIKPISELEG